MIKSILRRTAECLAPEFTRRVSEARWLRHDAAALPEQLQQLSSIEARVDVARSHSLLRSNQKRSEIIALLERVALINPRTVCEIGSDRGGTLALFGSVAAPGARILSLDISYLPARAAAFPLMVARNQSIRCLEADSHSSDTLRKVQQWLGPNSLEFLFIDGDHSYDGVKADYEMYGPLVASGGVIAFHDICPDFFTRFGTRTPCDVGEVPRYWAELRQTVSEFDEFIEDAEQDGYGIGMIRVP